MNKKADAVTSRWQAKPLAVMLGVLFSHSALALEITLDSGWTGSLNTTVSASSSWRVEAQDKELYGRGNGLAVGHGGGLGGNGAPPMLAGPPGSGGTGTQGGSTDSGNLNYDKGDRYSELYKFVTELSLSKDGVGGLLRAKGWYDNAVKNEHVRWGNFTTGWGSGRTERTLDDSGLAALNRADGLYLLDAYVYGGFDIGDMPAQVRVGRQVINWGESVFVQGVNQINPLDTVALRKAGTEIKEAFLPVWALYGNLGLPGGMSLEAFYQLKWEPTVVDQCGSYWSPAEGSIGAHAGACFGGAFLTSGLAPTNQAAKAAGLYVAGVNGKEAKDSGQWGVSLKVPVEAIDTEFGLYYLQINSRVPILSGRMASGVAGSVLPNPANVPFSGTLVGFNTFWEYPNDIRIAGLSAATTMSGWSVAAELSHQMDVPVQINPADGLTGVIGGAGPMGATGPRAADRTAFLAANGNELHLYDRYDKTQLQINGVNSLPAMLGAVSGLLIGEVAYQHTNLDKSDGSNVRYGRPFVFGFGSWGALNCTTVNAAINVSPDGCKNDGYMTPNAWGYRLRASLDYPGIAGTSWTMTPSLFFAHDVDGYSIDTQFQEGRQTLGLGLRFNLNREHNIELNYTTYSNRAKFDAFRDRDNASISYSYTF